MSTNYIRGSIFSLVCYLFKNIIKLWGYSICLKIYTRFTSTSDQAKSCRRYTNFVLVLDNCLPQPYIVIQRVTKPNEQKWENSFNSQKERERESERAPALA